MTDEYPEYCTPVLARRVLWQQYGIPSLDMTFEEALLAIDIHAAEVKRHNSRRANQQ